RRGADPRRRGVHPGVPGGTRVPGRPHQSHLRGDERDQPDAGHRNAPQARGQGKPPALRPGGGGGEGAGRGTAPGRLGERCSRGSGAGRRGPEDGGALRDEGGHRAVRDGDRQAPGGDGGHRGRGDGRLRGGLDGRPDSAVSGSAQGGHDPGLRCRCAGPQRGAGASCAVRLQRGTGPRPTPPPHRPALRLPAVRPGRAPRDGGAGGGGGWRLPTGDRLGFPGPEGSGARMAYDESSKVVFRKDDAEMLRAYASARETFRFFWREVAWEKRRIVKALDFANVKAAFADDDGEIEHMWLSQVEFDGQYVSGVLLNTPVSVDARKGDPARVLPSL